ncbi:hypothetical protein [Humidesulfovibrio idahonensis]
MGNPSALDVVLEEYKRHTEEIRMHIGMQHSIINYFFFFYAAAAAGAISIISSKYIENVVYVCVAVPIFATALSLYYAQQNIYIARNARFLYCSISPRIKKLVQHESGTVQWENFLIKARLSRYSIAYEALYLVFHVILMIVPSVIATYVYFTLTTTSNTAAVLLGGNAMLLLWKISLPLLSVINAIGLFLSICEYSKVQKSF